MELGWKPAAAKSRQSCSTLWDPIDGSPPGSAIPGILQTRTLEWVAISFSNAWKWKVKVQSLSHVWLFADPMDCSLPGSSVHGIFQARVLEWGAIEGSFFSTPSPAFIAYRLLDCSHSDWCEMLPHCGFDLHFSDNEWCWAYFHVFVRHLYVFFGEISV